MLVCYEAAPATAAPILDGGTRICIGISKASPDRHKNQSSRVTNPDSRLSAPRPSRSQAHDSSSRIDLVPAVYRITSPSYSRETYFDISHLNADLKRRTIHGGVFTLSSQAAKFILRIGSTAVLARLLTPMDFGLIAMVTVVTGFVEMFRDAGLSMATIQREDVTHAQVSTLFWINLTLSLVLTGVIAALAPAIASFYSEPALAGITLALACTMVFGGFSVQHQALLKRRMEFGKLAVIELASMTAGIATAVVMAWKGFGYWSLVGMTASTTIITAAMSLLLSGWMPGLPVRGSGIRPMLGFGGHLTGASFVSYFSRNGDNLLIGAILGPAALGYYNRGYSLLMMPWQQLLSPLSNVVTPALCRIANHPQRFRRAYRKALTSIAYFTLPTSALLFFLAPELVEVILGPLWLDVVPIFQALVPAAIIGGIRTATGWIYVPLGLVRRQFYWTLFSTPVLLGSFCVGLHWGTVGVATALGITTFVLFFIQLPYAVKGTCVRLADPLLALVGPIAVSTTATLLMFAVWHLNPSTKLWATAIFIAFSSAISVPRLWLLRRSLSEF
jgi:PST family polysaccharide transporter